LQELRHKLKNGPHSDIKRKKLSKNRKFCPYLFRLEVDKRD